MAAAAGRPKGPGCARVVGAWACRTTGIHLRRYPRQTKGAGRPEGRPERAVLARITSRLAGRPPARGVSQVLREYSSTLRQLGPTAIRSAEDIFELKRTDGSVSILHRVVTRLDRLYAVTLDPVTKRPRLASGAALAGAETWVPGERLTPEESAGLKIRDPIWASHIENGGGQ